MSGTARKLICSIGMASLASDTKLRGKKEVRDELCNQYWAKVLVAEEEALQNVRPWQQLDFVPIHATKKEDIRKPKKGQFLHKNYIFGKPYEADVSDVLNKFQTSIPVRPLHYPFEPCTEPPPTNNTQQLDLAQWREAFTKARIYLLGVYHFDQNSQVDAIKLVNAVQPDIFMFELDMEEKGHAKMLYLTDARLRQLVGQPFEEYRNVAEAKRQKQEGGYPPRTARLTKEQQLAMEEADFLAWCDNRIFGVKLLQKGNEFRAAFQQAQQVPGCAGAVLGDNLPDSIKIVENLKKGEKFITSGNVSDDELHAIGNEMVKFANLFKGLYTDEEIAAKQEEMIEIFKKFGYPEFGEHFVHARNRNMIRVLHTIVHRCTIEKFCASQKAGVPFEPLTVVALVGVAHLFGITNEWAKPEVVYAQEEDRG